MRRKQSHDLFADGGKPTDYKAVVFEYLLYWPLILLCLVLAIAGAYVYLRYQPPVYNVSSTVLIKQADKSKPAASAQLAMQDLGNFSMANNFDNEVEILQSFTLIKKVVCALNLYINYYSGETHFGYAAPLYQRTPVQIWMSPEEAERLPSTLRVKMDYRSRDDVRVTASYVAGGEERTQTKAFRRLPSIFITPVGTLSLKAAPDSIAGGGADRPCTIVATVTSPTAAAGGCKARLSAGPTSDFSSIVRLSFNDEDIRRGTDFLNKLVDIYNSDANDDKNQVAIRTARFIDERIRVINEELGTTENELADYKQRAGLTNLSADAQQALQGNSEYEQKRADNTNQLRLIKFLREYINNPQNRNEVIPVNVGIEDASLTNIIAQYNEMLAERKRLLRTSKETNPAVVSLDESISMTRNAVITTVESVEKGLQITRGNLDMEAGKYRTRIGNAPQQERELRDISRQQEIKSNLYLMLLQKREENAITLAATANNGRVVEEARASGQVAPNSRNTYTIAFILGLAFPLGCVWLTRQLRFKIEGRADVERITDLAVVGDIPQIRLEKDHPIVVKENRNELMEEIFRSLRTNLQYMLMEGQKVILFTSTTTGEGKSFCASNLAVSLALMDKKTLIVGLDIRKPSLNRIFSLEKGGTGITQYLAHPSDTDILSLCRPSGVSEKLYVLPSGPTPPNPTELVGRDSLDQAFARLRQHFDYIIVDTAPIGMVTDTQLIARIADVSVYVCRADYTRKNDFEYVNTLSAEAKLPHSCVLINGINMDKRRNGYYYGYGKYAKYGRYGRKYNYGYGYGE